MKLHRCSWSPSGPGWGAALGALFWPGVVAIALFLMPSRPAVAQAPPGGLPGQAAAPAPDTILARGYRILIKDRKSNLDAIQKILEDQDKAPREVRIESYVLQIEINDDKNSGIDLDFFFGPTNDGVPTGEFGTAGTMRSAGANQSFRYGSLSTERFQLFLDFLKRNTKTKVLSKPMLSVVDGGTASIAIGQQIPYVLTTVVPGAPGQTPVQGTQVAFSSVGINLTFTPTILPNDIVRMSIQPEISDVAGQASANAPPPTRTQRVNTTLFVKNHHAFLIGGMYRVDSTLRRARLPLLGNLPIIGDYFGENANARHRNEVVLVVKPTITSEEDFDPTPAKPPKKS
ncbi:MAG: type II and III secretion system protein [Candidatus Riflebacteria bacterium]|nr:type II and III secretion system protein [Candidatus Riflebacteria bacterium]